MILTHEQKLRELLDFGEECRLELKYAVSIADEFHRRESEPKPVQIWAITIGALTFDISGASLDLVRGRFYRAAEILQRCLIEYLFRLRYCGVHPEYAEKTLADADKALRIGFKAKDAIFNTLSEEFTAAERSELKPWLDQTEKPEYGSIKAIFEDFDKTHGKHIYEHIYALGSSYVHGKDFVFYDVTQPFDHPEEPPNWQSQRFDSVLQANWVIFFVLEVLGYVEKISDRGRQYVTLFPRHRSLLESLGITELVNEGLGLL